MRLHQSDDNQDDDNPDDSAGGPGGPAERLGGAEAGRQAVPEGTLAIARSIALGVLLVVIVGIILQAARSQSLWLALFAVPVIGLALWLMRGRTSQLGDDDDPDGRDGGASGPMTRPRAVAEAAQAAIGNLTAAQRKSAALAVIEQRLGEIDAGGSPEAGTRAGARPARATLQGASESDPTATELGRAPLDDQLPADLHPDARALFELCTVWQPLSDAFTVCRIDAGLISKVAGCPGTYEIGWYPNRAERIVIASAGGSYAGVITRHRGRISPDDLEREARGSRAFVDLWHFILAMEVLRNSR